MISPRSSLMNYKFIVARYSENIEWIKDHNHILPYSIIYNKGEKLDGFDQVVGLQNYPIYTRESDSYLTFNVLQTLSL